MATETFTKIVRTCDCCRRTIDNGVYTECDGVIGREPYFDVNEKMLDKEGAGDE